MEDIPKIKTYTISNNVLNTLEKQVDSNIFIILLNRKFANAMTKKLIEICDFFVCADGGANRIYDSFEKDTDRLILFICF